MFNPLTNPEARDPRWAPGIDISMVPLRKVIGRSSQINNGWHRTNMHPSGYLAAESRPELALFLVLAEMDPNVRAVTAQPTKIPFGHDGKPCHHFPDFAVIEAGESVLYEVKTRKKYADPRIMSVLASASRAIQVCGWPYFVALDTDMRDAPHFRHAESLWRRHRPIFTDLQRLAVERVLRTRERTVADVVADLAGTDAAPSVEQVLSLAANGRVFIDLTQPIGRGSIVRRADPASMPEPLLPRRCPVEDLDQEEAA